MGYIIVRLKLEAIRKCVRKIKIEVFAKEVCFSQISSDIYFETGFSTFCTALPGFVVLGRAICSRTLDL